MALKTISTSAGDFRCRVDEWTTRDDIANRIARRLGYRAAWVTGPDARSPGVGGSYQINLGTMTGTRSMSVDRTITVYRS